MRVLGHQFVIGHAPWQAITRAAATPQYAPFLRHAREAALPPRGCGALLFRLTRDAVAALTQTTVDADRRAGYFSEAVGAASALRGGAGIPRAPRKAHDAQPERALPPCAQGREHIGLTVDAEEADRLDLSLDIVAARRARPQPLGRRIGTGFGLAIQAYQKRALPLDRLARATSRRGAGRRLMVRLVERRLLGFRDQTRAGEAASTVIRCSRVKPRPMCRISRRRATLSRGGGATFYPCCFATHNAHTAAAVLELSANGAPFEFQRLHGMGEALYDSYSPPMRPSAPLRVYAPVGSARGFAGPISCAGCLENGANTSFVNRIVDAALPAGGGRRRSRRESGRVRPLFLNPQAASAAWYRYGSRAHQFRRHRPQRHA